MPHILDRYCNSMRYFGLLSPRSKNLLPVVFDLLQQQMSPKPARLGYALDLYRTFGTNPLIGRDGHYLSGSVDLTQSQLCNPIGICARGDDPRNPTFVPGNL